MRAQRLKMGEVIHAPPVRNRLFNCQGKVVLTLEKFHLNEVSKWSWQLLTNGSFISPAACSLFTCNNFGCFWGEFWTYKILESLCTQQTVDQMFKRGNWRFWEMLLRRIQKVQYFGKFWHTATWIVNQIPPLPAIRKVKLLKEISGYLLC